MNYIWTAMVALSLIGGVAGGNLGDVVNAGLGGAADAVGCVLGFAGIMCFWSGILALCEAGGLTRIISRALSPVLSRIFGVDCPALPHITMNLTANLLGMGNAATPPALAAMQELDRENNSPYPDRKMSLFAIMNTSSVQLIPATVAAMRAKAGSAAPFDIIGAVWICSFLSLAAASGAVLLLTRRRARS